MKPIVENLDDITERLFKMACLEAMQKSIVEKGLLKVPCTEEVVIYQLGDELVQVRAWSKMLSLFIVSASGTWLVDSHIDGRGAVGNINEAWRQFEAARPYIREFPTPAYNEYLGMARAQRTVNKGDKNIRIIKGEFTERKNKAGRAEVGYIVYGADDADEASKAVRQIRKEKETLKTFTGYADQSGDVYMDPKHGNTRVYVVFRGCVRG